MKNLFLITLTVFSFFAISCGNAAVSETAQIQQTTTQGQFTNVSTEYLNAAIKGGGNFVILDVRTPGEVAEGYIENAVNMDINNANFKTQAAELDKSETVYVYCRSGMRSQTASKVLIEMGFKDVRNVEGGYLSWAQNGFKTVK